MSLSATQQLSHDVDTAMEEETESRNEAIGTRSNSSRKRSVVWNHFDEVGRKVICRHCSHPLSKVKGSGTSHLKRHLMNSCQSITDEERATILQAQADDWFDPATYKFDQELTRGLLTLLFIDNEWAFNGIESRFWEPAMRSMRQEYKTIGRQTVRDDCVGVFKAGSEMILAEFDQLDSRVSFTSDIWTSSANLGYLCLTAHWIDKDFNFQKKIIGFKKIPYLHYGIAIANMVEDIWVDWKLDNKVFAITLDNCSANDYAVRFLEMKLSDKIPFGGGHMHMRCSAHILNLIVQEGMSIIQTALKNIREMLRNIESSGSRLQSLNDILGGLNLESKHGLKLDCPTRWNSTFEMVKEAVALKEPLLRYADTWKVSGPSLEEWKNAEEMTTFLEPFLNATKTFSHVRRPSSHTYMKEVWGIRKLLLNENLESRILQELAQKMKGKFEKYWANPNLILTIATVFDPRYKELFLKFCFQKAYGDSHESRLENVMSSLKSFYEEYDSSSTRNNQVSSVGSSQPGSNVCASQEIDAEFDQFQSTNCDKNPTMSELDKYLQEKLVDRNVEDFDILQYWKNNSGLYPTLARMARDFLAVQTSSVASESAFSAAGRLTDHLRTSMNSETLETLVCSKDWFGPKEKSFDLNKYLPFIRKVTTCC